MSATWEDEHLIITQKFPSGEYLFVLVAGENNVVGLIHNTPDIADTPEAYNKVEDVFDTMGYDILEAMELKNGKIFDDSYSRCGGEHEMDDDT